MRKINWLLALGLAGVLGFLPSCEILEECGTCELVTIDADGNETRSTPLPFCGEELDERKNSPPQTIGDITQYWDCY